MTSFFREPAAWGTLQEHVVRPLVADKHTDAPLRVRAAILERLAQLTPREREVMELLVAGSTSKEIATALRVSVRTVEGHRRIVLSKTKVASAAQLVRVVLSARPLSRA